MSTIMEMRGVILVCSSLKSVSPPLPAVLWRQRQGAIISLSIISESHNLKAMRAADCSQLRVACLENSLAHTQAKITSLGAHVWGGVCVREVCVYTMMLVVLKYPRPSPRLALCECRYAFYSSTKLNLNTHHTVFETISLHVLRNCESLWVMCNTHHQHPHALCIRDQLRATVAFFQCSRNRCVSIRNSIFATNCSAHAHA